MRSRAAPALEHRLETLRESPGFRNYQKVRDVVLRMKELDSVRDDGVTDPSDYWQEELENFEYMLDASPLVIEKLRHHSFHVTGLRVYEYRTHKDKVRAQHERKLEALKEEAGPDLLVPESPALGGFGFEIDGELYNLDTLKFYEVLAALDRGAVLGEFRGARERRLAWEIGAGWGGFGYQFKTLCPNTTYVITDFPELFLFSAVYLMTVFPEAKVRFYGDVPDDELWNDWDELDFAFLPHTRLDLVSAPRVDLAINMVSFQEMTTEQVRSYVAHASAQECPYLYSLNRDRSLYNHQLGSVREIISECYWPHEVEVLPVSYVQMLGPGPVRSRAARAKRAAAELKRGDKKSGQPEQDLDYKHVIGWRRVAP